MGNQKGIRANKSTDAFGSALGESIAGQIGANRREAQLQHDEDARDAAMAQAFGGKPVSSNAPTDAQTSYAYPGTATGGYAADDLMRAGYPRHARFIDTPNDRNGNPIQGVPVPLSKEDQEIEELRAWQMARIVKAANEAPAVNRTGETWGNGVYSYYANGMLRIEIWDGEKTQRLDDLTRDLPDIDGGELPTLPSSALGAGVPSLLPNITAGVGLGAVIRDNNIPLRSPQLPRLPASNGSWSNPNQPGNSDWHSTKPTVSAITGGKPVSFKNGFPNFEPWSKGKYNFPNLTGNNSIDFKLAYEKIAQEKNLPNNTAVERWLKQSGVTLHHNPNGVSLDLIPSDLHNTKPGIPHAGGATILRNWDYSKGTPWQEFRANQIAQGGRYLGAAALAYGAYVDASSLYGEYSVSQKTGDYSNTYNEAARVVGGWAGAWAVGKASAGFGAGFGFAVGGPVGGVLGGLLGGAIGGAIGYAAGSYAVPGVVNDIKGFWPR